jgi:hypothetical protein
MNKGLVLVVVMLVIIGGIYFYTKGVTGELLTSPSGIGGTESLWGQQFCVEYTDGSVEPLDVLNEPFSVYHNNKEVVAIRYHLSTFVQESVAEDPVISLLDYTLTFSIDSVTYILEFNEDAFTVPTNEWVPLVDKNIPIDDITGGILSSDTYRIDITPGGTISYKIGYAGQIENAELPIPVTDSLVVEVPDIYYDLDVTVIGNGSVDVSGGSYLAGTIVTITATPDVGNHFVSWSGDYVGTATNPSTTITMNSAKSLVAQFEEDLIEYTLTLSSAGNGAVSASPAGPTYPENTDVTCTPDPDDGYLFDYWSGTGVPSGHTTDNPLHVIMDQERTVVANFVQQPAGTYVITVTTNGPGSVILDPVQPEGGYTYNTQVTLTAQGGVGYTFSDWSLDKTGSTNPLSVSMTQNWNIQANFISQEYNLQVTIDPVGAGTVDVSVEPPYYYGTIVTLTAVPYTGSTFEQWSGGATGNSMSVDITMISDKNVVAHFNRIAYTLTTSVNPVGTGTVSTNPVGPYYYNDQIGLTATSIGDNIFDHWNKDGSLFSTQNDISFNIIANTNMEANFLAVTPTISVLYPDGTTGDIEQGTTCMVSWSYNLEDPVNIYLCQPTGEVVDTLAEGITVAWQESWSWDVGSPVGTYVIKVARASDTNIYGLSAQFTIIEGQNPNPNGFEVFTDYTWSPGTYLSRDMFSITATDMPRTAICYSQKPSSIGTQLFTVQFDLLATRLDTPTSGYGGILAFLLEPDIETTTVYLDQQHVNGIMFVFMTTAAGQYEMEGRCRAGGTSNMFDWYGASLGTTYHVKIQRINLGTGGLVFTVYTGGSYVGGVYTGGTQVYTHALNDVSTVVNYVLPMVGRQDSQANLMATGSISNMKITVG